MLHYILNLITETNDANNNTDIKLNTSSDTTSSDTNLNNSGDPSLNNSGDPNVAGDIDLNSSGDPNVAGDTDVNNSGDPSLNNPGDPKSLKLQSIQKIILYQKLRELQYKLDDIDVIKEYRDKDELIDFGKYLNKILMFFQYFTYDESLDLSKKILAEFKKLK